MCFAETENHANDTFGEGPMGKKLKSGINFFFNKEVCDFEDKDRFFFKFVGCTNKSIEIGEKKEMGKYLTCNNNTAHFLAELRNPPPIKF